jgi:hypothetical protein
MAGAHFSWRLHLAHRVSAADRSGSVSLDREPHLQLKHSRSMVTAWLVRAGISSGLIDSNIVGLPNLILEKRNKILQQRGKHIQVVMLASGHEARVLGRVRSAGAWEVLDCTQHSVALRDGYGTTQSIALDRVQLIEDPVWPRNLTLEIRAD